MRLFKLIVVIVAVSATIKNCPKTLNCFECIEMGCGYYGNDDHRFCSAEKLPSTSYTFKIKTRSRCLAVDSAPLATNVPTVSSAVDLTTTQTTTLFQPITPINDHGKKDVLLPFNASMDVRNTSDIRVSQVVERASKSETLPKPAGVKEHVKPSVVESEVELASKSETLPKPAGVMDHVKPPVKESEVESTSSKPGVSKNGTAAEVETTSQVAEYDSPQAARVQHNNSKKAELESNKTIVTRSQESSKKVQKEGASNVAAARWVEMQCTNYLAMRRMAIIYYKKGRKFNYDHAMKRCIAMMGDA